MSPKTAYLKQASEQRCREAFEKWYDESRALAVAMIAADPELIKLIRLASLDSWQNCWLYLEERLLKEIQS